MTGSGPDRASTNTYRLETERLVLAVPSETDAPSLYQLVGGKDRMEVTAGLIWDGPDEIGDTIAYIRQARTERWGDGGFHWAIHDRTGELTGGIGTAIGMISARPSDQPGRGDVERQILRHEAHAWIRGQLLQLAYWNLDHDASKSPVGAQEISAEATDLCG